MKFQPLLSERSASVAATLTIVPAVGYGAICGAVLGQSKGIYSIRILFSLIDGLGAGLDHDDLLEGPGGGCSEVSCGRHSVASSQHRPRRLNPR